jgi:pantoate--beta-alanine ligase
VQALTGIAEMRSAGRELRAAGKTLGLVPTMGALHAGHLALVRAALESCDAVAVSIFVNPKQFGPNEDFSRYPRTFEEDCRLLDEAGVQFVFAPSVAEMYPGDATTFVDVGPMGSRLDGASRPGHFRGVTTVVAKLFQIVDPDLAFFGQKDAAQVAILRKMVRDLDFRLELRVCPIVREQDGLALSSRNRYLSETGRRQALILSRALNAVQRYAEAGAYSSSALIEEGLRVIREDPAVRLDYFSIVDPDTLEDLEDVRQGALVAVAAWVGQTRLIDNLLLPAGPDTSIFAT